MATSRLVAVHDEIAKALAAGEARASIARRCSIPASTLKDYINGSPDLAAIRPPAASAIAMAAPRIEAEVEALTGAVDELELYEDENRRLRSALRKQRTTDVEWERLALSVQEAVKTLPLPYAAPSKPDKQKHSDGRTLVLLYSDAHYGEIVSREAVNGLNEYDPEISRERHERLAAGVLSHAAHGDPVTKLIILALGDNQSGDNHEELSETNAYPAAEQAWQSGLLLGDFTRGLVNEMPGVDFELECVPGNHPRVKKKPVNKEPYNNFDWLGYKITEQRLRDLPQVAVNAPRQSAIIRDICGKNAYIWHGDGIRSSMPGVPWGGVMRRTNEIRKQFADQMLSYFFLGHLHQLNYVQSSIFMNGSIKGVDEYVLKNFGGGEPARQMLVSFSNRRSRVTGVHPIDLQD